MPYPPTLPFAVQTARPRFRYDAAMDFRMCGTATLGAQSERGRGKQKRKEKKEGEEEKKTEGKHVQKRQLVFGDMLVYGANDGRSRCCEPDVW